jgi:DNA polymerase-3 subunit alpha
MNAIMTAESGDVDKISEIIEEAKRMGITVLPPDVNASFGGFTVVKGSNYETERTIRFGLYTIKNLGTDIADSIIAERRNNGDYKNLEDFLTRTNHKNFNKKSYEALVKCGAMDSFGERGKLLANTETVLEFNKKIHKIEAPVGPSLFGEAFMKQNSGLVLKEAEPMAKFVMLQNEKDLLGLYVTGHPLDNYREKIEKLGKSIISIKEDGKQNDIVICAGIITDIRDVYTKSGDHMAIVKMADFTGTIELAVFPKTYKDVSDILVKENCIAVKGKVNIRNDEKSIALESIKILTE